MIHHDTRDVVTRAEALMRAFGWRGGTIHQIAEVTGCDAHDLIYKSAQEHDASNKAGWFAYTSNSLEYNKEKILPVFKGNLQFWLGVAGGVQTAIKLGKETPRKF